jgi:hypothetical protein
MNEFALQKIIGPVLLFTAMTLVGLFICLFPSQAQAAIENNILCTRTGGSESNQDLGVVSPGQRISSAVVLDCTIRRRFPVGASVSSTFQYVGGRSGPDFVVGSNGRQVPRGGMGTNTGPCLPSTCMTLPVNYKFTTVFTGETTAATEPGSYMFHYSFFVTSIGGWENYADSIYAGLISYRVESPSCTLVSAGAVNLYFGTLSSADLLQASRQADIGVSCQSAARAAVKLTPSQNIVNGAGGVSATTLAGLSMVSTWADTGGAVNFGSTRTYNLQPGNNTLGIRFQPQLNGTSVQAVGDFSSQYTLTITYL